MSRKNKKKKYHSVKKKYTIASLSETVKNYDLMVEENDELSEYDTKLYNTMTEVLEFTKESYDLGIKLDLNMETEKNQEKALAAVGFKMQKVGVEESAIVQKVMEIASSYQLFQLVNLLVRFNLKADIILDDNTGRLIIKGSMPLNTKTVLFDPYSAMDRVKDECFLFKNMEIESNKAHDEGQVEAVRSFGVSLGSYRDIVVKELLERF